MPFPVFPEKPRTATYPPAFLPEKPKSTRLLPAKAIGLPKLLGTPLPEAPRGPSSFGKLLSMTGEKAAIELRSPNEPTKVLDGLRL